MSRFSKHAISICLIGIGGLAWSMTGMTLVYSKELEAPLNPMGINGSPYGEVFAMAMQGPIDTYFHGATTGVGHVHPAGTEAYDCKTCTVAAELKTAVTKNSSVAQRFQTFIGSLSEAEATRTNPRPASKAQKLYLRRKVEDKLRFAYHLDPSHYANYNSLHFFLTEPEMGTRPELTPSAAQLADDTIAYCMKEENDPRPYLTAAGACTNMLQLMFSDRRNPAPKFSTNQMRQYLAKLDLCISRYENISKQWDESKNWDLISPQRIEECEERFHFIGKIRDASEKTIERYDSESAKKSASPLQPLPAN